jgi:hypothetical protein
VGGEPASGVLDYHHIAARDKELVITEVANELLSIGKTKQQYRKFAFGVGSINIREQRRSVSHFGWNVKFLCDSIFGCVSHQAPFLNARKVRAVGGYYLASGLL